MLQHMAYGEHGPTCQAQGLYTSCSRTCPTFRAVRLWVRTEASYAVHGASESNTTTKSTPSSAAARACTRFLHCTMPRAVTYLVLRHVLQLTVVLTMSFCGKQREQREQQLLWRLTSGKSLALHVASLHPSLSFLDIVTFTR